MGFSRQEYWSELSFPPSGDLLDPGIKPEAPALAGEFFTTEPPRKPIHIHTYTKIYVCICIFVCIYIFVCVCVYVCSYCYLESPIIRQNYYYYLNVREKIDKQNLICATEFLKYPNTATCKIDQGLIHLFCILRNWCWERLLLGQGQV